MHEASLGSGRGRARPWERWLPLERHGAVLLEGRPEREALPVVTPFGDTLVVEVHPLQHSLDGFHRVLLVGPELVEERGLVEQTDREEVLLIADHPLGSAERDRLDSPVPLVFPTRTVLVLVLVVPLVVALVSWMASTTAQPVRPVRVSTATFE